MIQISIFDETPIPAPRCRCCGGTMEANQQLSHLCVRCLATCPQRKDQYGRVVYLTARIYPADWRDDPVWQGGKSYPLYYQDAAGVIWEKSKDVSGEYVRWQG